MNNDNYELALMWTYIWNYVESTNVSGDRLFPVTKLCRKHLGWNNEIESYLITWNYHSLLRQVKAVQEAA